MNIEKIQEVFSVAQTSKSAVARASKPEKADLEVGDTAGLETCAKMTRSSAATIFLAFMKLYYQNPPKIKNLR